MAEKTKDLTEAQAIRRATLIPAIAVWTIVGAIGIGVYNKHHSDFESKTPIASALATRQKEAAKGAHLKGNEAGMSINPYTDTCDLLKRSIASDINAAAGKADGAQIALERKTETLLRVSEVLGCKEN